MLELEGLNVTRGASQVLHDVSLSVPTGTIGLALGTNGAGKTTLLETVAGLHQTQGAIKIDGTDVAGQSAMARAKSGVLLMEQGRSAFAGLTVEQNLRVLGASAAALQEVYDVFPELASKTGRSCELLSGGEVQMLKIAMAMVRAPRVLLVDELSFGLSPKLVRRILPLLDTLTARGMTILMVEQFAEAALKIADRAHVLCLGRIVLSEAAGPLRDAPDRLQQAYFGHTESTERATTQRN
ncbi:MAG: ATP-binding cassette domain-containing protein [Pseudomonadota bacterium]